MDCTVATDSSFGPRVAPCRRQFDFTLAFEHWALTLIPELGFILCGLARWLWMYSASTKVHKLQSLSLSRAKLGAASLLLALKTALLVVWATSGALATAASAVASVATLFGAGALFALSQYEHNRTTRPSTLICLYLLVTTLFEAAQVRTLWLLQPESLVLAAITTASFAVRVVLLAVEAQGKVPCLAAGLEKPSPESTSGILSCSVYWWINGLFTQGFRSELTLQNLYSLDGNLKAKALTADLYQRWCSDKAKHRKHALLRHTFGSAKWIIIRAVMARSIVIPLKYAQPFLFNDLIDHVSSPSIQDQDGTKYGLLGAVFIVYTLLAATNATYRRQTIRMMTSMRGGLVGSIYAKVLNDKQARGAEANALTFMSTDVDRIVTGVQNVNEIWAASIEIIIAFVLLALRIGYPSVAALVVAAACIIGCSFIAPKMREKQWLWVQAVQERVNFTTAILKVMRQVKTFGIEATMGQKTNQFRKMELNASKPFRLLIVGVNVLNASATALAPAVTIILYTATRMNLATEVPKPDEIFTSLSLIALLASSVALLSLALTKFISGIGSFDRIQDYLLAETKPDDSLHQNGMVTELVTLSGSELVRVQGGSFRYGNDGDCQLNNMTFIVNRGEIVAIAGPLSCGKSTLLKAVLSEIACVAGQLSIYATSVAYCQQTPYIFNGTI